MEENNHCTVDVVRTSSEEKDSQQKQQEEAE